MALQVTLFQPGCLGIDTEVIYARLNNILNLTVYLLIIHTTIKFGIFNMQGTNGLDSGVFYVCILVFSM